MDDPKSCPSSFLFLSCTEFFDYGTSPYAFCHSNPVNYVDVDGEFPDFIWDLASIGMGVRSLVDNIQEGNTRAAIGDGVGIVADVIAAAIPVLPGGVGAVRAGAKAAAKADDVVDAARAVDNIKFKSFTARNFRDNLARLTGRMPDSNVHAHHIFPKGVKGFKKTSINPNDPRYGIWLDKDLHLGEGRAYNYNIAWEEYLRNNQNPTTDELFEQARKLMKEIYETEVF